LYLADQFGWKCISTGDLLRKEVLKKSEVGKKIQDAFKNYQYGK
jgi:adenylate kinase family enzyme